MNPNRDEISRQLHEAEAEQRSALPRFASALRQAFDPARRASRAERAELVGLATDRRGFLRIGGMTVAASALLVACSNDAGEDVAQSGPPIDGEANDLEAPIGEALDTDLLLTASSLEALAVATYADVIASGAITDSVVASAATLFAEQHAEHLDVLVAATRAAGATPYTEPNPYLDATVVQPALDALGALEAEEAATAALDLAYLLENTAAQTYTWTTSLFSSAELRQAANSIGSVEARHISVLLTAAQQPAVPFPLMKVGAHVPDDALITPDGPLHEPPATTTTTAAEGDDDEG